LEEADRVKIARLVGINVQQLPVELPGRLGLCWALLIADKEEMMERVRNRKYIPTGDNPFEDHVVFCRRVRTSLAMPEDPQSRNLWIEKYW
jgi:hypothetical protein